jgi:hypothetical protein
MDKQLFLALLGDSVAARVLSEAVDEHAAELESLAQAGSAQARLDLMAVWELQAALFEREVGL